MSFKDRCLLSATVQKPVFVLRKINVNIFSPQIDFTNLYVASLVYLSRKIYALAPIPKHDCPRMYFLSAFPHNKNHNITLLELEFSLPESSLSKSDKL